MNNNLDYRAFNISDAEMLEDSQLKLAVFKQDIAMFQAQNPTIFSPQFIADWELSIEAVQNLFDDETVVDQQTQLTEAVEQQMEVCRNLYQLAKPHIELAFPDKPLIWNEFGFNDYEKSRTKQAVLVNFMRKLYNLMLKYGAQLATIGWTQNRTEEVMQAAKALDEANQAQELFISSRPVVTQTRRQTLNKLYSFTALTCRFGKLIFRTDMARRSRYLLAVSKTGHSADNMATVVVPPQSRRTVYTGETPTSHLLEFYNSGKASLEIWADSTETAEKPLEALRLEAGQRVQVSIDEISVGGETVQYIIAYNADTEETTTISLIRVLIE